MLRRMRDRIRTSAYVMTLHAQEEMEADALTLFDVEHCVLTGRIEGRERDRSTAEWKYVVRGATLDGGPGVVVAKIGPGGDLVIITVYRENG